MAASVLHFGADPSNRVLVLRSAGYLVEDCPSIPEFRSVLKSEIDPEALFFSNSHPLARTEAANLARSLHSRMPLILFENVDDDDNQSDFDLVIRPCTPPVVWLQGVAETIERTRRLGACAATLRGQSQSLVQQSQISVQRSIAERERSAIQRRMAQRVIQFFNPKDSDYK